MTVEKPGYGDAAAEDEEVEPDIDFTTDFDSIVRAQLQEHEHLGAAHCRRPLWIIGFLVLLLVSWS